MAQPSAPSPGLTADTADTADTSPDTAPPGQESGGGRAPDRDSFFDNAKYLAVVLVAMGHAWEPLRASSRIVTAVYMLVYAFHMPAFIVISGYFSRNFDASPRRLRRLVTGVAVPYVIFEVAYTFFTRWTDGAWDRPVSLLEPLYLTWFLASLFVWRLTTPLWRSLRWPLPVALVIAMPASLSPTIGEDLDLQRMLQFLPFFVLGLCLRPEHFRLVRRRPARIAAIPVFVGGLAFSYWAVRRMNFAWFFHRDSAQELGAPGWAGPVMTLALFACSVVLVACFLAWVPGRRAWFTALGAGTLYGYLLHGFVIQLANHYAICDRWSWTHRPLGVVALTLAAGALITVLCTPPVRRVFRFAIEPRTDWAFRRTRAVRG